VEKKSLKILVMEEEDDVRGLLFRMFEYLGYHHIKLTKEGTEAVAEYRSAQNSGEPYDLVILDLTVYKGMGGVETLEKLMEINQDVIAIVSSGYPDEFPKGFSATLPKPYSIERLGEVIEEVMKKDKP